MREILTLAVLLGILTGCSGGDEAKTAAPFQSVTDTKQLMGWILDPSADVIWGASGYVVTEAGTEDLTPTTDAGWDAVRNAAAMVAETGNLLLMPEHARPGDGWAEIAQGLTAAGKLLIDAAERRDSEAVFNGGGTLYDVCVSCHQLYLFDGQEPTEG